MSTSQKVKLDTLYKVRCAFESAPHHYSLPTVEIYSAESDVTIRATTVNDFVGTYDQLPVVTSEAAQGDVFVSVAGRAINYMSFSSSDSNAEVYISGFIAEEVPYYELDTVTIASVGEGYIPGQRLYIAGADGDQPAVIRILDVENGNIEYISRGKFASDISGTITPTGSSAEIELTVTAAAIYE